MSEHFVCCFVEDELFLCFCVDVKNKEHFPLPSSIVKEEFLFRIRNNSNYSLRAFARDLNVSPSTLSEIFNCKKGISLAMAKKMAAKLFLSNSESNYFYALVGLHHSKNKLVKQDALNYLKTHPLTRATKINLGQLKLISDWYYFALLSAMELDDFDGSANWLSKKINLPLVQVKKALRLLNELGYAKIDDKKWKAFGGGLETPTDITSQAIRKGHRQVLEKAITALDQVPPDLRDITNITMAIDIDKIPEAKRLIKDFKTKMSSFLEKGKKNNVYTLNIQLMPLTNLGDKT